MNLALALILGIILLVVGYMVPQMPPPGRTLCLVLGWILVIVAAVFLVLQVLGVPVSIGA